MNKDLREYIERDIRYDNQKQIDETLHALFGKRKTVQKKLQKYQSDFYAAEPETINKFDKKKNG